jgi:hypothetical protein
VLDQHEHPGLLAKGGDHTADEGGVEGRTLEDRRELQTSRHVEPGQQVTEAIVRDEGRRPKVKRQPDGERDQADGE